MMYFMNVVDFPINIGNRPPHSPPAFIPITFELAVLLGGRLGVLRLAVRAVQVPHALPPAVRVGELPARQHRRLLPVGRGPREQTPRGRHGRRPAAGRGQRRGGRGERTDDRPAQASASRRWPLLGLAGARSGCDEDTINPMAARQPRVGAYSGSEFYSDGMGMRAPPAGTVPRERVTGNPGLDQRQAGRRSTTQRLPRAGRRARCMRLGQKRYNIICATCHGPLGDGDSIVARQMSLRPPPSLIDYADRPTGYIFEVVSKGHGLMASYAAELTVPERWAVVAYVRALQVSRTATLDKAPLAERTRLEKETP